MYVLTDLKEGVSTTDCYWEVAERCEGNWTSPKEFKDVEMELTDTGTMSYLLLFDPRVM
jgi:hypothetical protein